MDARPSQPAAAPPEGTTLEAYGHDLRKALPWLLTAVFCFTILNALIREITTYLHVFEIVFWRNLFAVILVGSIVLSRKGLTGLRLNKPRPIIARGVLEFGLMSSMFYALSGMPLAEVVTLVYTMPLFMTMGAAIFLGETVRAPRWIATLIGFSGALIIMGPGLQGLITGAGSAYDWHYPLIALLAAILMAASGLILRHASKSDPSESIMLWMSMIVAPIALVPALGVWTGLSWTTFGLLVVAVSVGSIAHYTLGRSYQAAEVSAIAPYRYTELIFAAIAGFALFGEIPSIWSYVGAAIIAGSGIFIAHREALAKKRAAEATPDAVPQTGLQGGPRSDAKDKV